MTTRTITDADIEALLRASRPQPPRAPVWHTTSSAQIRAGHLRRGDIAGPTTRARTFLADVTCRFCTGPGLRVLARRVAYVLTHQDPHAKALARQAITDHDTITTWARYQALIHHAGLGALPTRTAPAGPPPQTLPQRHHVPRPAADSPQAGHRRPDQDIPRIDSTSTCAGCDQLIVYDELVGWIHTGTPSPIDPTTERTPTA